MKMLYIANMRIPSEKAHTIQILKMCEAFIGLNNVELDLIIPHRVQRNPKFMKIKNYFEYYGIKHKFKIIKIPSIDFIWIDLHSKILSSFRFKLQSVSFAIFTTIYVLLKQYDVCYTRDTTFTYFFGLVRFSDKKKLFFESHVFSPNVAEMMKKRKINGLIVITKNLRDLYLQKGVPIEKIFVAPDGTDLKMFEISDSKKSSRKKTKLPYKSKIIGYIGQLSTMGMEKGTKELIDAYKILKNHFDNLILCFVGGRDEIIKEIETLIKNDGLKNKVILTGQKKFEEIPLFLKSFDVCVIPFPWNQHYAYYTSPLKLFEYMASKRPIVTTDLPSIREILNEENAVFVKPGSSESLAEGIKKVLTDEKLSEKIAIKAYKDVIQYSWNKRAEKILIFIHGNMKSIDTS